MYSWSNSARSPVAGFACASSIETALNWGTAFYPSLLGYRTNELAIHLSY